LIEKEKREEFGSEEMGPWSRSSQGFIEDNECRLQSDKVNLHVLILASQVPMSCTGAIRAILRSATFHEAGAWQKLHLSVLAF
jgi:hypothetical protein